MFDHLGRAARQRVRPDELGDAAGVGDAAAHRRELGVERELGLAEQQAAQFEDLVAQVSPGVAGNSRVADTRRSLALMAERLRKAL